MRKSTHLGGKGLPNAALAGGHGRVGDRRPEEGAQTVPHPRLRRWPGQPLSLPQQELGPRTLPCRLRGRLPRPQPGAARPAGRDPRKVEPRGRSRAPRAMAPPRARWGHLTRSAQPSKDLLVVGATREKGHRCDVGGALSRQRRAGRVGRSVDPRGELEVCPRPRRMLEKAYVRDI